MKKIQLGIVGLGQRGSFMLPTFLSFEDVEIVALCDIYDDRLLSASNFVVEKRGKKPSLYKNFDEFIKDKNITCVYVASSWEKHVEQTIICMKQGIPVGMEVGGAYSIKDCWKLVKTYEKYKTPMMLLENCCYDKFESLVLNMNKDKLFGDIVHCNGCYSHDLRDEILGGNIRRHYRLRNYISRNCENYPTHELGPIAKLLNLNTGNRIVSICSVASASKGLKSYAKSEKNPDKSLSEQEFKQGDIVSTILKCENGETITLTLDTTLPGYYSRKIIVKGTEGSAYQENNMVLLEKDNYLDIWETVDMLKHHTDNAKNYYEKYLPEYWKNITPEQISLGHGGMDCLMLREFLHAVKNNLEMPIDVYDAALWYAVTPLSEKSIKRNGKPYKFPDFTKGKYKTRKPKNLIF